MLSKCFGDNSDDRATGIRIFLNQSTWMKKKEEIQEVGNGFYFII